MTSGRYHCRADIAVKHANRKLKFRVYFDLLFQIQVKLTRVVYKYLSFIAAMLKRQKAVCVSLSF